MPLSGFPKDQTNPDPINVDQETLVYRRAGFSPALSLLMPTFAFQAAPAWLTPHLLCCLNALLPLIAESKASVLCLCPLIIHARSLD